MSEPQPPRTAFRRKLPTRGRKEEMRRTGTWTEACAIPGEHTALFASGPPTQMRYGS